MRTSPLFSTILASCLCLVSAETYRTKVAILGGGVSGISAALNLTSQGITDFMMIEARDVLGGRAQDHAFGHGNVELGCNWVQGLGDNPINQLAHKYKLNTAPTDGDDVVFYNDSGKIDHSSVYKKFNDDYEKMSDFAFKRLKNDQVDLSGRASLDIVGWHPKTPLDYAVEYYVYDWEMGEDAEVSSSIFTAINDNWTYTSFGPNSDGDNMVVDNRGFKHVFLEEAKKVFKPNDKRLKLGTTVTKVSYNSRGVTVHTDKGDTIKADYVISTFSIGVLQNHDIEWEPALPEWKMEGIFGFHMATYTKIFLNFPEQFWDDNQFTVWVDPNRRGYYAVWQNLNAPGFLPANSSDHIFFATVTQEWAYMVESMSEEEVKKELMEVLRRMYGDDIPEATDILYPRWHSNPLFRGSYSNWPIGELDEHHANMKAPVKNRVFFAGEAMSSYYFGFLQGAWFSGAEVATQIGRCIKKSCPAAEYYPMITNAKLKTSIVRRSFL